HAVDAEPGIQPRAVLRHERCCSTHSTPAHRLVPVLDTPIPSLARRGVLLADPPAYTQATSVYPLTSITTRRGCRVCFLPAFPAVGVELLLGSSGLAPVELATSHLGDYEREEDRLLNTPAHQFVSGPCGSTVSGRQKYFKRVSPWRPMTSLLLGPLPLTV